MSTQPLLKNRDAAPEVIELLELARAPRPLDAATRERSRRRLAALTGVPAAAGVMFWLQKSAFGALLGAALGGAVLVPQWIAARTSPAPHASAATPKATEARRPRAAARSTATLTEGAPEGSEPARTGTAVPVPSPTADVRSSSAPAPDVEREARLLEDARSLLATKPAETLRVLRRHEREFSAGTLLLEREFLRVDALVRLGRTNEARERARALERLAPGHLYEQRLRSLLDEP